MKYTLFTYRGLKGLRIVEKTHTVIPFVFAETSKQLKKKPDSCIEITALVYFLQVSSDNRYTAYINLREMTNKTVIIVDESVAQQALSIFDLLLFIIFSIFMHNASFQTFLAELLQNPA